MLQSLVCPPVPRLSISVLISVMMALVVGLLPVLPMLLLLLLLPLLLLLDDPDPMFAG